MSVKSLQQLKAEIAKEEDFCIPDVKKSEKLKPLLKSLYDESTAATEKTFGPLTSLIVAGIDEERIWEELQTRSRPLAKFIERKTRVLNQRITRKLNAAEKRKLQKQQQQSEESGEGTDGDDSEALEAHGDNDDLFDDDFEGEEEEANDMDIDNEEEVGSGEEEEEDEDEVVDGDEEGDEEENAKPAKKSKKDDMKAEMEMEAWLDAFEEMENKHLDKLEKKERRAKASTVESKEWSDEEGDEEDDLDFVEKAMYDSEMDDDDEEDDIDPAKVKFDDFFVDDSDKKSNKKNNKKRSSQYDEDDEDEDDDMDFEGRDDYEDSDGGDGEGNEEDDEEEEEEDEEEEDGESQEEEENKNVFLTSFQRRKKELAQQIKELERELVADKPWELKGEVKAGVRPENSLLDLAVDVDRATKSVPIITQEYTSTLEDAILQRIKDARFDDPKPRNLSMETSVLDPSDNNNDEDLSQEKSKKGLGEIYAEEYAKKIQGHEDALDVQTQAAREEVINLFNAVSRELDALSHFFYSPKPVASEASAKVLATQRALPALEMEDIAPYSQNSAATAAAPEEIMEHKRGKKVTLLTSAELTREDRKKLRRHNKEVKKAEKAEQEKDTSIKNLRKQANKKLDEELRADKRVVLSNTANSKKHEDQNQFSKSSAFFSKLQEDTHQQIKNTVNNKVGQKRRRDSTEDQKPAAAFKL